MTISFESIAAVCSVLPCSASGGGAAGLSAYVLDRIVTALEIGVIAAALVALFVAAAQMTMFGSEEGEVKNARTAYIYIIVGLVIVALARWFVIAFSPTETGDALVNPEVLDTGVSNVVTYFRLVIAISLMVNIVVQAFRLIMSQGEQEQTEKAKKRLIAGFVGAGIILLANVIVVGVLPETGSDSLALEIAGVANYLITLLGFLAVIAILVAGILLIVSVDEGLKDKAKNIVKASVIALIIVVVSYALVTAFIALE